MNPGKLTADIGLLCRALPEPLRVDILQTLLERALLGPDPDQKQRVQILLDRTTPDLPEWREVQLGLDYQDGYREGQAVIQTLLTRAIPERELNRVRKSWTDSQRPNPITTNFSTVSSRLAEKVYLEMRKQHNQWERALVESATACPDAAPAWGQNPRHLSFREGFREGFGASLVQVMSEWMFGVPEDLLQ